MEREQALRELEKIVGAGNVLASRAERTVYSYDASVFRGHDLLAVVFPETAEHISELVAWCNQHRIPYIARGSGTAISGGSIPTHGGIMIELAHMNRVLEIDTVNRYAVVEPGVVNQDLKQQLAEHGYGQTYVPDPGSQVVSTIGGNVATNAGGMHCLKYGITSNHILGLEVVLPNGDIIELGGRIPDQPGADLTGLLVGSEGTLGIVTKIIVRLMRLPEAVVTQLALFKTDAVGLVQNRGRCRERSLGHHDRWHSSGGPGAIGSGHHAGDRSGDPCGLSGACRGGADYRTGWPARRHAAYGRPGGAAV